MQVSNVGDTGDGTKDARCALLQSVAVVAGTSKNVVRSYV
jgi:hypothetical protein